MRVMLGSGGYRTPERQAALASEMRRHFGDCRRLLFLPYALADHDAYVRTMVERGLHAGYELDSIHQHSDPQQALREAEAIYVGGGNTFRLLHEVRQRGLLELIRERVLQGVPYLGSSAGSNLACPTIMTTNDMPIVQPTSFHALGLVPFQLNPYYFTGSIHVREGEHLVEHFGETRDDRLREFHEMNATPVIGLWEAGVIHWDGNVGTLIGTPARVFHKGEPPEDWLPGTRFEAIIVGDAIRLHRHDTTR